MAICEISNGTIMIAVDSKGAELKSLKRVTDGQEYMWSADPAHWGRVSPLLFPQIGGLKGGTYRYHGQSYEMPKHGFVRDVDFRLVSQEADEIWFSTESNDETRKCYPFEFKLEQGYRLEEDTVHVMWRVENLNEELMYFSLGGHPAFRCPLNSSEKREDYYLKFDQLNHLEVTTIGNDGLASREPEQYSLKDGVLKIHPEIFDRDALVLEGYQVKELSLLKPDQTPYITTNFDLPVVAVWSQAGGKAPFICIEPWCGLCDFTDFEGTLEERKWEQKLEAGGRFESGYSIKIYEQ